MKMPIFLAAITVLAFHQGAGAEAQYPYIAPNCNPTILVPPGLAGYYMSADCKTAYVLPALVGTARVGEISDIANLEMCDGLKSALETDKLNSAQILADTEKLATLEVGDKRRDQIRADIAEIKKD